MPNQKSTKAHGTPCAHARQPTRIAVLLLAGWLLGSCAATPATQGSVPGEVARPLSVKATHPKDPWERMNRSVMRFNDAVDETVLQPVAKGYRAVVPSGARTGIGNFFSNLSELWSSVNHVLQGEFKKAGQSLGRFTMNTLFGLGGFIDVASAADIPQQGADFGQTLGRWGVPSGPYLVLPLFGPSTVRDAGGLVMDLSASPLNSIEQSGVRDKLQGLRLVDTRASLLDVTQTMEGIALDRYSFVRDAFLQRRGRMIEPQDSDNTRSSDSDIPPKEERFDIDEPTPAE